MQLKQMIGIVHIAYRADCRFEHGSRPARVYLVFLSSRLSVYILIPKGSGLEI